VAGKSDAEAPGAGWRLLVALLPNQHEISMPTPRPSWRDWALTWSHGFPSPSSGTRPGPAGSLLVDQLGGDLSRWKSLIKHFEKPTGYWRRRIHRPVGPTGETALDEEDREACRKALRDKVATHKRFATAAWSLPREVLRRP